jgi:hypothetical protein
MNGIRQDCPFITPDRVNKSLAARGVRPAIFRSDAVYPCVIWLLNVSAVITLELQHEGLEGLKSADVAIETLDLTLEMSPSASQAWEYP